VRIRVRFRVNAVTGEVETFVVEDLAEGTSGGVDHDAAHDRATADVARVIEQNALFEQFSTSDGMVPVASEVRDEDPQAQAETPNREPGRAVS
jgi:hypothetical protein